MAETVTTTCPYCGVGCGISATPSDTEQEVRIEGDKNHPANLGKLCSKGSALAQTLNMKDRLLSPQISGQSCDWNTALNKVAKGFAKIIDQYGPEAVAFYGSGQLLTEDYYVANKLMKGYIGSANIDTNSRLCMASSVVGHKRAFGADTVPCCYEDLERAKLIVLTGSNAAWCHPILYQRIVKAKKENPDLQVIVIDPRKTATCDIADLHLPLTPATDTALFNGLLVYLADQGEIFEDYVQRHTEGVEQALSVARETAPDIASVATICGLEPELLTRFYRLFSRTDRVITVYSQGINQSSSGSDKVNAIINCHLYTGRIGRPGMGPFSFTGQPNAMGGREVGGLANQLAAHMDIENPQHRQWVQQFWQSPTIATHAGLKAVELFDAIEQGKVKAVWIMATNPVVSLPDADRVISALQKCELVVLSDVVNNSDTAAYADVLLPALAWGEKDGTVTNSERRISRQRAFLPAPGEAKPDWWIVSEVAKRLGFADAFSYQSPVEIFREHAALSTYENQGRRDFDIGELKDLSEPDYDQLTPIQWPIQQGKGKARFFADGHFFTPNGKARFIAVTTQPPKHACDENFPLILNTGRVRDQWHTMTRTGKAPRLSEHSPEPFVAIHPDDALRIGIKDEDLARVFSRWGEAIVRVQFDESQPVGQIFVPMHWNNAYASAGRIGAVVNPEVDPYSAQPELKHTPVRVTAYAPVWHGFILSRRRLNLKGASYWALAQGDGYFRYEIAGDQLNADLPSWARSMLCSDNGHANWVEYLDSTKNTYRGVRMIGKCVDACMFIAPSHALPSRSWLAGLFAKNELNSEEQKGLLTGKAPMSEVDSGRVVCACFSVGINTIEEAIRNQQLYSTEEIGEVLKAGTNCGSCLPELKNIIAQVQHIQKVS